MSSRKNGCSLGGRAITERDSHSAQKNIFVCSDTAISPEQTPYNLIASKQPVAPLGNLAAMDDGRWHLYNQGFSCMSSL